MQASTVRLLEREVFCEATTAGYHWRWEGNLPVLGTLWGRWRLEDEKTLEELKADGSLVFEVLCVLCELCVFIISGGLSSPWQGRRGAERRG